MLQPGFGPHDIVVIGASAGGVEALRHLLGRLPGDLPASVLVVLHRSPEHVSHLAQILARATKLSVTMAKNGEPLKHGVCYLADTDQHLLVGPGLRARLVQDGFYRAHNIDALFCSSAINAGARVVGVVLSGILKDGAFGLRLIKDAGGVTLVQDPAEASYPDMPLNALQIDGTVDMVGTLEEIAARIRDLAGAPTIGSAT